MKNFKVKVGLFFIVGHFFILLVVFVLKIFGGYTFDEFTTLIGFLIPMLASFSTTIIKDIINNAQKRNVNEQYYSPQFRFLTIFICSLYFTFLAIIVILRAFNYGFEDFEQLKATLGIAEVMFGAYIAQLIFSIYRPSHSKHE